MICETLPKNPRTHYKEGGNFIFEGFNTIENNNGRGVCIIHKEEFEISEINDINKLYSPSLFINVKTKISCLNLGIVYRSPNSTTEEDDKVINQIDEASKSLKNLIIVGDFNHPEIDWQHCHTKTQSKHKASQFLFKVNSCRLHQLVNKPTHMKPGCKPSLIDLVLTKDPDVIEKIKLLPPLGKSFHSAITIKTSIQKRRKGKCLVKKYQVDKGDYAGMKKELNEVDWEEKLTKTDNVDEAWNKFAEEIHKARDKFIPTKTVNTNSTHKKTYVLEDSLVHLTRLKRIQYKIYKKYPSRQNYLLYTNARKNVTKYTRKAKRQRERKIAKDIKSNSKAFYQFLSSKISKKDNISELKKKDGTMTESDEEKSTELNEFFASVFTKEDLNEIPELERSHKDIKTANSAEVSISEMKKLLEGTKPDKSPGPDDLHPRILKECANELAYPLKVIFDLTMKTGKIPQEWKQAEIRAIYKKKGAKSDPSNYRPVSLTSVVCKLMEKIVKKQLNQHLKDNNLLAAEQYGFVSGRSTDTQLLTSLAHWQKALDEDIPVDVVYMDFKKAFDSVPHVRLLNKLKSYGIEGHLLSWIKDFLGNRSQFVKVNNAKSNQRPVTSGVPQGSVLGPTLFIYFINDLPLVSSVNTKIFADDTKAYSRIESENDKVNMQETIDKMYEWTQRWQLMFNETKCKVLHLGQNNEGHAYYIGNGNNRIRLEVTELEKDLGVYVDKHLNFEEHINKITSKAASKCARILKNFSYRNKEVLVPIFKTIIRPILEYANSTWCSGLKKNKAEIEKVQRIYTKNIYQVKHLSYEDRLKRLQLPSLEFRQFRGDLIQTYKIARNIYDQETVANLFSFSKSERLRGHRYKITKFYFNKVQYKHFFTNRVTNHWNNLPSHIVEADSLNSFKNKIDEHFKDIMYKTDLFD